MRINPLNTKIKNAIRIDRAIKFVWRASPLLTCLSGLILIASGVLPVMGLYLLKLIIDTVTKAIPANAHIFQNTSFTTLYVYIGLACGIGLLIAVFNFLSDYIKKAQTLTVSDYMYNLIHQKSFKADLEYYESPEYQDTLHRAQREGPYRPISIVQGLFSTIQNTISFVAVIVLLCTFNPVLPLLMIGVSIPGVILRLKYSKDIYSWQTSRTEDERRALYFNYMLTDSSHAKEFRLFNIGNFFNDQFNSIRNILKKEKLWFEKRRALGDFIAQASAVLAVFASFLYIAVKTINGIITIGDMVMYFQAFQRGLSYLKTLLQSVAQMYEDNLFLSHLYDFLNLKPKIADPEIPNKIPEKSSKGLELKNVHFNYPNCEKNVLNYVNFSIKPGEIVALVGENGSGKSTIVKLLTRLYDPPCGEILFENKNIKKYSVEHYRKLISVIFQDHIQYSLSVKENIYLGDIDQKENISKIEQSAIRSGINPKIVSLPNGYDTILGRWFKGGEELSIGQWQMLAIARAFFRDSRLVILDEPSSALDPKVEMDIFTKLKKLIKDRSALIISHRYSTVKLADKILVLDKGHIIEQGSHRELIHLNGKYAKLYNTQANSYISP